MKAILEFTLPEEHTEFEHAARGLDYHSALADIREELRKLRKYNQAIPTFAEAEAVFYDCLKEWRIDL